MLSALAFDQRAVTGVEINPSILELVNGRFGDFTGHLDRDPRVRFVNDEARSYIARMHDRVDIIQISLIDTWAATASGAFVLTENSLYTVEAWTQLPRTAGAARHPLGVALVLRRSAGRGLPARRAGLDDAAQMGVTRPGDHFAIVRARPAPTADAPDGIGTMLVSRDPLSAARSRRARGGRRAHEVRGRPEPAASRATRRSPPSPSGEPAAGAARRATRSTSPRRPTTARSSSTCCACATSSTLRAGATRASCVQHEGRRRARRAARDGHGADGRVHPPAARPLAARAPTCAARRRTCVLRRDRLRVHARGDLPGAAADDFPRPPGLQPLGGAVFAAAVERRRQPRRPAASQPTIADRVGRGWCCSWSCCVAFGIAHARPSRITSRRPPHRCASPSRSRSCCRSASSWAWRFRSACARAARSPSIAPWLWGVNGAASVCASVLAVVIAIGAGISAAFWAGVACYGVAPGARVAAQGSVSRPRRMTPHAASADMCGFRHQAEGDGCRASSHASRILPADKPESH